MFKIGKKKEEGFFFAYGKHICYGDFVKIGLTNPVASAFAKWLENGVYETSDFENRGKSFRFWAEGPNGELVCGVLSDSSDSCGREYPLITAWSGVPNSWKKLWFLIPKMCRFLWEQIESLNLDPSIKYESFEKVINHIKRPCENWKKADKKSDATLKQPVITPELLNKLNNIDGLLREDIFRVNAGEVDNDDLEIISLKFNELLRSRGKTPAAVFTGGFKTEKYLIFIYRQFSINDFKYIWSEISGG